jgi:hypothetical protein
MDLRIAEDLCLGCNLPGALKRKLDKAGADFARLLTRAITRGQGLAAVRPSRTSRGGLLPRRGFLCRWSLLPGSHLRIALLAAIWMVSPVCGFRPWCAGRAVTLKCRGRRFRGAVVGAQFRLEHVLMAQRTSMLDDLREQIGAWLSEEPGLPAIAILARIKSMHPDRFTDKQERSVQRAVKQWRAQQARRIVIETPPRSQTWRALPLDRGS